MKDSISDMDSYLGVVKAAVADDSVFSKFKTYPGYTEILEHVSYDQGLAYLHNIEEFSPELLEDIHKFSENDLQGSPVVYQYSVGSISPTTLRYIKVLSDLITYYGSLDGMDIVEIGCGYGGQSKIICEKFNVASYTYIDLPDVINLISKYTSSILPNQNKVMIPYKEMGGMVKDSYDLIISNYAFTECTVELQNKYIDSVLNRSKRGYITCNFVSGLFNMESLTLEAIRETVDHKTEVSDEVPLTFKGNCILHWGTN